MSSKDFDGYFKRFCGDIMDQRLSHKYYNCSKNLVIAII